MNIFTVFIASILCFIALRIAISIHRKRAKANGTYALQFVWVEDDGSIRILSQTERDYLNTDFLPNDSARPYIKPSYETRPPDGKMSGFIRKSRLPRGMPVSK